jgi:hypothetical protein
MSDRGLYEAECVVVTGLACALALLWLVRALSRTRPELRLGMPVAAAFALRLVAAGGVSQLPNAGSLRGGDETLFTDLARDISHTAVGSRAWWDTATSAFDLGGVHELVFALQYKLLDSPEFALRTTQAAIAVAGLALMAAAVCELAGPRPAMLAAWLLALEPSGIFFSTLLHKEALLLLAEGLVVYGGAVVWRRGGIGGILLMALGCAVALGTRPYVGWFLAAGAGAIAFHAALRLRVRDEAGSMALASLVVLLLAVSGSFIWGQTSPDSLERLQDSQSANASDTSNLKLERVDYSTRAGIVLNLPRRVRDVLLRPYPWQLKNVSQQLGALGSLVALAVMALLIQAAWRARGHVMQRAGPFVYVAGGQLVAYALSVANAGTGFRYRSHLVALAICMLMALWEQRARTPAEAPRPQREEPLAVPS